MRFSYYTFRIEVTLDHQRNYIGEKGTGKYGNDCFLNLARSNVYVRLR
jgi:hypothetical protein